MKKRNTTVISFVNNKGGSGKTTSCANTGYSLASMGKKVLMVDGDMQLNLSLTFFNEDEVLNMAQGEKNLYNAIKSEADLSEYIVNTRYAGVDLIPSSMLMSGVEYELFSKQKSEKILEKCLSKIVDDGIYDYVLIDAPPTLGGWVQNILQASDYCVMPVEASPWGLFGVANMFEFMDMAKEKKPSLELLGILVTKVDKRRNYDRQTIVTLNETEGVKVFDTVIRIDSEVTWSQDDAMPILEHKKSARSGLEYLDFAKELDRNVRRSR